MNVRKEDFPVVLQAYDLVDNKELFLAEQVVNNQADVDTFSARFAGKLIKAKQWATTDTARTASTVSTTTTRRKSSSATTAIVIILIILIVLAVVGYYTGWIQENLNIGK